MSAKLWCFFVFLDFVKRNYCAFLFVLRNKVGFVINLGTGCLIGGVLLKNKNVCRKTLWKIVKKHPGGDTA